METKICVDCKQTFSLFNFYKAKGYKNGYHTACKKCFADRNRRSSGKRDPDILKASKRYYRDPQKAKAYRELHKARDAEVAKKRRARKWAAMSDEEKLEFRKKKLEVKRIHRAKKYGSGGRHSELEWQSLLKVCNYQCARCGSTEKISRDHIVPLTSGGSDDISNIQPLCISCNSSKNRWHATDYRTGEVLAELHDTVAPKNCLWCGGEFKFKIQKKKFCSKKCCWSLHNRTQNAKIAERRRLAREEKQRVNLASSQLTGHPVSEHIE